MSVKFEADSRRIQERSWQIVVTQVKYFNEWLICAAGNMNVSSYFSSIMTYTWRQIHMYCSLLKLHAGTEHMYTLMVTPLYIGKIIFSSINEINCNDGTLKVV